MKRKALKKKVREEVLKKYNNHCAYCGCKLEYKNMQIDHIIPHRNYSEKHNGIVFEGNLITEYGINDIKNLNPACRVCNNWKSVWEVEEFRREIELQTERLQKNSSGFRIALMYDLIEKTGKEIKFYFEYSKSDLCPLCGKIWESCKYCRCNEDHQSCVSEDMCHECYMES